MNDETRQFVERLLEGAVTTVATEMLLLGLLGGVLVVLFLILFRLGTGYLFGSPSKTWAGTWRAVWILCMVTMPNAGCLIGAGEGMIRGGERALRESEFGRKTVPKIAEQSVYIYAAVYYADPKTLQSGSLGDFASLDHLAEVRRFANGSGTLETERLKSRMQEIQAKKLSVMAREARDDFARMTPVLADDFPELKKASDIVLDYAVAPPEIDSEFDNMARGPLFDIDSAALRRGDPSTVTRDELAEHLRERVAIPGLLTPIRLLVRPWQIGAWILIGFLVFAMTIVRFSAADREPTDDSGEET